MNKGIAVIIISILLVIGSVYELILVTSSIDEVVTKSNDIIVKLNSGDTTENVLSELDDLFVFWNDRERVMCLFINHRDMEKVGEYMQKARSYLQESDEEKALEEIKLLSYQINMFKHQSEFNAQNIF